MSDAVLVMGVFETGLAAAQALTGLREHGISQSDTSIVAPDSADAGAFGIETHTRAAEGAALGGSIGGAAGALIAGFTAVGAVASGGVGLIAAGPLVAALVGAGAGAAAGGVLGGLMGFGIPEHEVRFYSDALNRGSVLVGARVQKDRAQIVRDVMQDAGATKVTMQAYKTPTEKDWGGVSADEWAKHHPLRRLFIDQLMDVNYAEAQLIDALQEMEDKATSPKLAAAFSDHRAQTATHRERIHDVFRLIGVKPAEKKCPAIKGIIAEARELMKLDDNGAQRDAAMICAAQKAEHYEIGSYGCLRTYAETLGLGVPARILNQTLSEEYEADQKLTELAEGGINRDAALADSAA